MRIPQDHKPRIRRAASAIIRLERKPFSAQDRSTASWNRGVRAGLLLGLEIGLDDRASYNVHTVTSRYLRRFSAQIAECLERDDSILMDQVRLALWGAR